MQALQRARISPDGMLTFFQTMRDEDSGKGTAPGWISSHPQTATRVQRVSALIDATPCPACLPLSSSHWQAMKAALPPAGKQ